MVKCYCANRLLRCASNQLCEDDDQSLYTSYIYLRMSEIKSSRIKNERVNNMVKKSQRCCQAKSKVNQSQRSTKVKAGSTQVKLKTSQRLITMWKLKINHGMHKCQGSKIGQESQRFTSLIKTRRNQDQKLTGGPTRSTAKE